MMWTSTGRLRACLACVVCVLPHALPGHSQEQVFRGSVSQVVVDVIVTDADGQFVDNLTVDDFVVLEDGAPQPILSFELVNGANGPAAASTTLEALSDLQGRRHDDQNPRRAVADATALIYLVDLPGLDWKSKERFTSAWSRSVQVDGTPTVPQAVYMIDQMGNLEELVALSIDVAQISGAIEAVRASPLVRRGVHEQLVVGRDGELRASDLEERSRSYKSLQRLTEFCHALRARPGRKALIWVTSELQMMESGPFAALAAARAGERNPQVANSFASDRSPLAHVTPDPRVVELQDALYQAANSANVSIYAVDPTPQVEWRSIATQASNNAAMARLLNDATVQGSLESLRDALQAAAVATSGRSFIGWTELEAVFSEIETDASRYYLLAYATPAPIGDNEYHDIRVEVDHGNASVRARSGYVDMPAELRDDLSMSAALSVPGIAVSFSIAARAAYRWTQAGEPVVQMVLAEDQPTRSAAPAPSLPVDVRGVALDVDGKESSTIRLRLLPRASQPSGDDAPRPFVYVHDWSLAPGKHELRFALREEASGRLGAGRVAIDVPEDTGEWQTSDLLLVAYEGERTRPLATDVIARNESLAIQVEVDHGSSPVLSGIVFEDDGATLIAELPPVGMVRNDGGIHRGMLRVTGFDPGEYLLQVSVIDSTAAKHRILRRELTVLPTDSSDGLAARRTGRD